MKHTHQICLLLASTRKGLANDDTQKVLTKIQVSKSILQLAATNCVQYIYGSAFQSKIGYALLMRTIVKNSQKQSKIVKTSKATVNDARYKVSRIVKLVEIVEIVEIKVDCHFYFYYAFVGLYSVNIFC